MSNDVRQVTIPEHIRHESISSVDSVLLVELLWVCPRCGGPRGEPEPGISYDGSHRMHVHQWTNPCGHIDFYRDLLVEAHRRGRVISKRSGW